MVSQALVYYCGSSRRSWLGIKGRRRCARQSKYITDEAQCMKQSLNEKHIKVVGLDLPTSWMMAAKDETTARMFDAINNMMLGMLAAIARKDYVTRRKRAAQGVEKAKAAG